MIAGWDDAPAAKVYTSFEPKHVTFVYPFYANAIFFRSQVKRWIAYPEQLRRHLSAIVVDDGTPECSAEIVLKALPRPFPIRLFYIEVDKPWNWLAARNIAMQHADGWCVATDMDHVIPQETAEALVWGDHDPNHIYRFSRVEHTGKPIHPHPNSWFMTKEMFWKFGGYDERLSGHYGSDGDARRRWANTATVYTLNERLIRHEYISDSSTTKYKRKQPADEAAVKKIVKARGKGWKPKVLSFPFHEVML